MKQAFILISILGLFWHCEPRDEILTNDAGAKLEFSTDSILFDTIFTEIRNVTKRLRVYNRNNNALNIASINLKSGSNSAYTITVNGDEGTSFKDIFLRGKDSIYILINIKLPSPASTNTPFLVDDEIQFFTNGNIQSVFLRSWGQDAIFYQDSLLDCNLVWTDEKPIVIIKSVGVPEGCKLTIREGTKIYLDNASSILVFGTLEVLGTFEKPVIFSGIRQEEEFENIPGQWGNDFSNAIWFFDGSSDNVISWSVIQNATTAIRLGSVYDQNRPDLTINNSIIKNMAGDGIITFGADIAAFNNLITNCGSTALSILLGGNAQIYHNTIANYSFTFTREDAGVFLTDFFPDSTGAGLEINVLNADIQNNIIWGNLDDEFNFNFQTTLNGLNVDFNVLKISNADLNQLFSGNNNILSNNTSFLEFEDSREYDFQLDTLSPAKDKGNPIISGALGSDLKGDPRNDGKPDMGAYERLD